MRRTAILMTFLWIGCGTAPSQQTGLIPAGSPSRVFDPDGDGISNGTQYDTDGDGTFDAVDVDGDGLLDGGDFDGDGVVTIFAALGSGLELMSEEELARYPEDVDPDFEGDLDGKGDAPSAAVTTRASVDLTATLPRPVSQGKLGSCAAFATSYVATGIRAAREGVDPNTVWGSPQFLYAKMLEAKDGKCNDGTSILSGVTQLIFQGMTPNAKLPYSDSMCAMNPALEEGDAYRIGSFSILHPFSRDKLKEHLSAGHAIVFGASLAPNFGKWGGAEAKGVFKSVEGQLGGQHGGGHAMVILGYDDARSAYRVLNSWGTDWGDGGYLWWDYADLESRQGFQAVTVTAYRQLPPAPSAVEEPSLSISTGRAIIARGKSGDRLVVAAISNAPLTIGEMALDEQPSTPALSIFAHGYLTARSVTPLAAGMHTLTVRGVMPRGTKTTELFAGPSFERRITVNVGEPVTDPDNAL